jgi:hypothetical protein
MFLFTDLILYAAMPLYGYGEYNSLAFLCEEYRLESLLEDDIGIFII